MGDVNCLLLMGRGSIIIIVVDIVVRNGVALGQPVLSMNPLFFSHWLLSTPKDQECEGNCQRPATIDYVRFGEKLYVPTPQWGKLTPGERRGLV